MSFIGTIREEVQRAIDRLAGSIVRRGLIGTAPDSAYFAQVTGDDSSETLEGAGDGVEVWQHYGFTSRPPVGAEVALICPDGQGVGAVSVAEQDRAHRPSIAASESCLYGPKAASQATLTMTSMGCIDAIPATGATVDLGGVTADCNDYLLKGTTFNVDDATVMAGISAYITLLGAALQALGADMTCTMKTETRAALTAAGATPAGTATGLITAFLAGAPARLSLVVKVK